MNKIKNYAILTALIGFTAISSCKKDEGTSGEEPNVSENFSYNTTSEINVDITTKDHFGTAIQGLRVNLYSPDLSKLIASGVSDADGSFASLVRVPTYMTEVRIRINYHGFENDKLVPVTGSTLVAEFGGLVGSGKKGKTSSPQSVTPAGSNWYYIGSYDSEGVPNYLDNPGDVVDAAFIGDVSSSLPEFLDIPVNKANYLAPTNAYDIHLLDSGDIWITYLAEGAGQKNTMGYYVYETNNPPIAANQIDTIYTILPNASNASSGGGLVAGNKVYLGKFAGGKSIGWVLMANGWDASTQTIKANNLNQTKFYSTYSFNPEGSASLRQHNVQLLDAGRELVIVGFEDVRRDYSSDNDFNDLLFSTRVTPYTALDISSLPQSDYCDLDDDNDGVKNCDEDYRYDADRAYDNFYTGTLGFEDLWPGKGDYDFNDLVVAYKTNQVTDASNNVKDIKTTYTVKALGGSLHHGFGVEIDGLLPADVSVTSGTQSTQSLVSFDGKGLEAAQTNAVLIAYDDIFDHVNHVSGEPFINTVKGNTQLPDAVFQVDLSLTTAIDPNSIGLPPYDPFMFVKGNRGREIHMLDEDPTDLANTAFFGTASDASDPQNDKYYRTDNNLPWVIHVDGTFSYPKEYSPIETAYTYFTTWANSDGSQYSNWYLDLPGYRNSNNVY